MPELPEVETIRRHLADVLPGRTVTGVELRLPKLLRAEPGRSLADLIGRPALGVGRRAKLLLLDFGGDQTLIAHLKLTGQIIHQSATGERRCGGHPVPSFDAAMPHKSTHLIMTFDDGGALFLTDIRQFGVLRLVGAASVPALLAAEGYGPDALDPALTPETLAERLRARPNARLKPVLLDQTVIAGLGNIYVDEALYSARLHPLRTPGSLTPDEAARLLAGIGDALEHGLSQGGFTILNGRARPLDGYPRVHGLAGAPCPACGTPIVKTVVGGRGTYLCPSCQPTPDDARAAAGVEATPALAPAGR
jgi:formamidopyrimidine-DNA glycosylase